MLTEKISGVLQAEEEKNMLDDAEEILQKELAK